MALRALSFNKEIYLAPLEKGGDKAKVNIELYLPPSDIPQNISSNYVKEKDVLLIEFDYPIKEKPRKLFEEENISLFIGASSSKPLRIEINKISEESIDQIKLSHIIKHDLSNLIEKEIGGITNLRKKTNLERADKILKENAENLACGLA